ncbi:GTP-binding protein HflX [Saprospira grandis DSM 2844]|uniref:GTPase HflX n=1 Tax=Saprospira grandis DSM 2844 TaxID=694433 RepID=J0P607_9BACT|nr:GTPase HflX [Saprospira grandis]EJF52897.1 GTP-binding protein HflX [Saprospira grandis DSM 2844]
MSEKWNLGEKNFQPKLGIEKAVLVAVILPDQPEELVHEHLDELEFLAETAGAKTVKRFTQRLDHPDRRTFVRKGKMEEIRDYVEDKEINLVIFDDDLTGKQTSFLEEEIKCKIVDRSSLILDIFASNAQTAQAKAQVELAQMQYLLPRLRGLWTHLERQRGGIGMRGPGEKEIETDRRIVRDRIALLKKKLAKIDLQASTQRKSRQGMIRAALVGYTNVGKSTLMNRLGKSEVLVENKLFATLDTTVRKVVVGNMPFLLSDTVGFIRKLPHHLVESFKSTLDEVRESDLLIHVIDISHPQYRDHIQVVEQTLKELGAGSIPCLYVFNKMDRYRSEVFDGFLTDEEREQLESELRKQWQEKTQNKATFMAVTEEEGIEEFKESLSQHIGELYIERYPHKKNFWY